MRMLESGRQDRGGAMFVAGLNLLPAALHDAPAVIAAALNSINHFPKFPTHIRRPDIARLQIDAHSPRVAKAVGPDLGAGSGSVNEGIIRGDAVAFAVRLVIHVNP